MSSEKTSIFDQLAAVDKKQYQAIENETFEKQVVPFVLMRWATCDGDPARTFFVNEYVNPYAFSLYKHKRLLWKLLCTTGDGSRHQYQWIKGPQQQSSQQSLTVIQEYYKCSQREAQHYLKLVNVDDLLEMAEYLGKEKDEITKLKNEFKKNV